MIVNQAPKPASFSFDFRSNLRAGSTKIGFSDGAVTNIMNVPPMVSSAPIIPVREHHLKGVVDPLSAIMMLSRNIAADPCDRRIAIFDGKERFDLLFSRKGDMRVTEQAPSGQPGIAHVCRVRYLPIAGHKIDSDTKFMAANDAIEVALRPVPAPTCTCPIRSPSRPWPDRPPSSPSASRSSRPASRRSRCCIEGAITAVPMQPAPA